MSVAGDLPTLPAAHTQALAMMSCHDAGAAEIAGIVEGDPVLTASVLRASNSAAYAPLSPIRTANDAIVRIGLSMTRRIVAGAALGSAFSNLSRSGMDVDELWRHVVACALLADATAWADGPRPSQPACCTTSDGSRWRGASRSSTPRWSTSCRRASWHRRRNGRSSVSTTLSGASR